MSPLHACLALQLIWWKLTTVNIVITLEVKVHDYEATIMSLRSFTLRTDIHTNLHSPCFAFTTHVYQLSTCLQNTAL